MSWRSSTRVDDNFFHAAFGGSFLNHFWLVCACTPDCPNAPQDMVATKQPNGQYVVDNPDGTTASSRSRLTASPSTRPSRSPRRTTRARRRPRSRRCSPPAPADDADTSATSFSAKGVSWAWFSGGWNDAVAGNPDPLFQFHHQPFNFFKNYASGQARTDHLKDETDFMAALQSGNVPAVSFIKPLGPDNEHPGYANICTGRAARRRPDQRDPEQPDLERHGRSSSPTTSTAAAGTMSRRRRREGRRPCRPVGPGHPRADDRDLAVREAGLRRPHPVRHHLDPEAHRDALRCCRARHPRRRGQRPDRLAHRRCGGRGPRGQRQRRQHRRSEPLPNQSNYRRWRTVAACRRGRRHPIAPAGLMRPGAGKRGLRAVMDHLGHNTALLPNVVGRIPKEHSISKLDWIGGLQNSTDCFGKRIASSTSANAQDSSMVTAGEQPCLVN